MRTADETATEAKLYERISHIVAAARGQVARTVNSAMVNAYWRIGREIVVVEQSGAARADYGDKLLERLAQRLQAAYGRGLGRKTLERARAFYLTFPDGSVLVGNRAEIPSTALSESPAPFPPVLGWSHYLVLMRVRRPDARAFYEIEAAREGWSVRDLDRQVSSLLFERLGTGKTAGQRRDVAGGHEVASTRDVIKDPFVLEFLDLQERPAAHERDLEQAIIDRLEAFMLELGKGFCFVARQKRITIEGDHFYVDLVFYNRLLRAFVLFDLKLGKLTHQDLGQMQMYVNYFDRHQRVEHEARTIGIVLCSEKNEAMVNITLPEDNEQIVAARYQTCLPTEDELRRELAHHRDEVERVLRLTADAGET